MSDATNVAVASRTDTIHVDTPRKLLGLSDFLWSGMILVLTWTDWRMKRAVNDMVRDWRDTTRDPGLRLHVDRSTEGQVTVSLRKVDLLQRGLDRIAECDDEYGRMSDVIRQCISAEEYGCSVADLACR